MAKAILEFDLENPDDRQTFELVSKADSLKFIIFNLDQRLRNMLKYGEDTTEEQRNVVEGIRKDLHDLWQAAFEVEL